MAHLAHSGRRALELCSVSLITISSSYYRGHCGCHGDEGGVDGARRARHADRAAGASRGASKVRGQQRKESSFSYQASLSKSLSVLVNLSRPAGPLLPGGLGPGVHEIHWETLSKQIMDEADNLTGHLLARTVHSFRVAKRWDSQLFKTLFSAANRAGNFVYSLRPIEAVTLIHSIGRMAADQKKKKNSQAIELLFNEGLTLYGRIIATFVTQRHQYQARVKGRELSSILHGLGCYSLAAGGHEGWKKTITPYVSDILMAFLKAAGDQNPDTVSPMHFATALHGLANTKFNDAYPLSVMAKHLKGLLSNEAIHADSHTLSLTIWSLSKLKHKNPELLEVLGKRVAACASEFNPQGLSNVVYGFGVLGHKDEHALAALGREVTASPGMLEKQTGQGLANIVYGFGLLGHSDDTILEALGREISKCNRLGRFNEQELANMVYGFGLLGYNNEVLLSGLGAEICKPKRLALFTTQGLSNIVYGLGLLQYHNPKVLETLAKEVVLPQRLKSLSDQGYATVVYGFGKSAFLHKPTLAALLSEAGERLGKFSPEGLSIVLYGIALLGRSTQHNLMLSFLDSFAVELNKRDLQDFSEQSLCTICFSLGELRYRNDDLMSRLVLAIRSWDHPPSQKTNKNLSVISDACAVLSIKNDDCLRGCQSYVMENCESMSTWDCALIMWSMAVLGVLSVQHFEHLCRRLLTLGINTQGMDEMTAMQVSQASLYINIVLGREFDSSLDALVVSAKAQCMRDTSQSINESLFEKFVQGILVDKGVAFQTDKRVLDGVLDVDIFIPGNPGVVIECDGPMHYTINKVNCEYQQLGDTQFRNQLLRAAGYKVVCIPYFLNDTRKSKIVGDALGI